MAVTTITALAADIMEVGYAVATGAASESTLGIRIHMVTAIGRLEYRSVAVTTITALAVDIMEAGYAVAMGAASESTLRTSVRIITAIASLEAVEVIAAVDSVATGADPESTLGIGVLIVTRVLGTPITEFPHLPKSIYCLTNLLMLELHNCNKVEALPGFRSGVSHPALGK
ncbi:hypothetical protein NL676_033975 [Syzygium grande]|nr:hypothetical protein NL676_033975 [Syzygium grande]